MVRVNICGTTLHKCDYPGGLTSPLSGEGRIVDGQARKSWETLHFSCAFFLAGVGFLSRPSSAFHLERSGLGSRVRAYARTFQFILNLGQGTEVCKYKFKFTRVPRVGTVCDYPTNEFCEFCEGRAAIPYSSVSSVTVAPHYPVLL